MTSRAPLIDCDVHIQPPSQRTLLRYLPAHWTEYFKAGIFTPADALLGSVYPPAAPSSGTDASRTAVKADAKVAATATAVLDDATDRSELAYLQLLRETVLDGPGAELAIANCYSALEGMHHPYLAPDMVKATNDWVIAEYLDHEERLRGSIMVTPQFPDKAVEEIERLASDQRFVQVLMPARSLEPYGTRRYWPIFAAAAEHGLVVALHFGGMVGIPPTSSGWPSYYIEEYVGMAQIFQTQVTSLTLSGVFSEYPDLRISLCEGGFSWLPNLMWQLDKRWKGLRKDIPWVVEEPSNYIRRHMRATIQPADLPPATPQFHNLLELIGSKDFLLYASDFPHVHATPAADVLAMMPEDMQANVASLTARSFYPRITT